MNKNVTPTEVTKGHNKPPVLTPDELVRDYAHIDVVLDEIETAYKECPTVIEDDEDLEVARSLVKRLQTANKRLEAVRVEVKDPFLNAGRIVDSHFKKRMDRMDELQTSVDLRRKKYLDKKAAEEKARREEEARIAAEAAARAAEEHRQAEAKRIAAEQERAAREAAQLAEEAIADQHDGEHFNIVESPEDRRDVSEARQEETIARERALAASAEALSKAKAADAKPADLARTRTGDGISTLELVWKHETIDIKQAMKDEVLLSFISTSEIEKAIDRYVKTHKGDRPLAGVRIYSDTKPRMT